MVQNRNGTGVARDDRVNLESSQFRRKLRKSVGRVLCKAPLDLDALALDIAKISEPLQERRAGSCTGVGTEVANPWNFLLWLCLGGRAKSKEEDASKHSNNSGFVTAACCLMPIACCHRITLSARASTLGGIVNPISFAVFKLMTSSNFVGCSTGKSAGLAPLRILSK